MQELADLLFHNISKKREYFEKIYPKRNLQNKAEVLRVAPSPTGPMHIGTLYMALISSSIAKKTGGKFILRIEDTDREREVDGAREFIISVLNKYNIKIDEGEDLDGKDIGNYGPYRQSKRKEIYEAFAYDFVLKGYAYPCFLTEVELEEMRAEQKVMKQRTGVYGKYAKYRDLPFAEIKNKIINKEKYVIRLKASGDHLKKRDFYDEFMGSQSIPENDEDFVLIKKDGLPTYHFAHVIDDYLMGTTFVTRGEEWLSSLGKHLELWDKLGVNPPKYGHIMPINKLDGSSVRKISKRKDAEATMMFYEKEGYPKEAIIAYLYRLANPDFDFWWEKNKNPYEYDLDLEAMRRSGRGPLLDFKKLDNISADVIAYKKIDVLIDEILNWMQKYDEGFYKIICEDLNYLKKVLSIERDGDNPRKDIYKYSLVKENIFYFYDKCFVDLKEDIEIRKRIKKILEQENNWEGVGSLEDWVNKMKEIYQKVNQDNNLKFADFMMILRKAITSKTKTPNLYYIFQVLGRDKILERL